MTWWGAFLLGIAAGAVLVVAITWLAVWLAGGTR